MGPDMALTDLLTLGLVAFTALGWTWDAAVLGLHLLKARKRRKTPTSPNPRHRFAFLVPAHNEEAVIGPLLDSVAKQEYPKELFHVYVAADRCTDRTAEVARSKGATVIERWEGRSGKTWNLRYALERIPLASYDYLVVVDADNLVAPDFLKEIDRFLQENPDTKALQTYLDTKNPFDTWITKAIATVYWLTNFAWFRSREVLGLSATLGGTGMVLSTALLRERGWKAESLTEDLELHVDLVLQGERVRYLETARVYDEKPLTLRASYRQRVRWYQGHWYLLFKKAPLVLREIFRKRGAHRLVLVDTFLYLLAPARYLASLGLLSFSLATRPPIDSLSYFAATFLGYGLASGALASLWRFGRLRPEVVKAGLFTPPYGLFWFPVAVHALAKARDQKNWAKTLHTRSVEVEKVLAGEER